jgi:hypothetical protein
MFLKICFVSLKVYFVLFVFGRVVFGRVAFGRVAFWSSCSGRVVAVELPLVESSWHEKGLNSNPIVILGDLYLSFKWIFAPIIIWEWRVSSKFNFADIYL